MPAEHTAALQRGLQSGCSGLSAILLDSNFAQAFRDSEHVAAALGGGVVLVANASAIAVTYGLSAPLAELSKAAGGAILIDSTKAAWKDLKDAPLAQPCCG